MTRCWDRQFECGDWPGNPNESEFKRFIETHGKSIIEAEFRCRWNTCDLVFPQWFQCGDVTDAQ